jgi:RNA polymerase sigma-70 factor (ECF subfamily)
MDRREEPQAPADLELIQGVARGSADSFRLLFRRWSPRLGRFLMQATGSRETAEDLLQEAFLRILRAAPRFTPRGEVGSWMYRICANLAYSHWRRIRSARSRSQGLAESLMGRARKKTPETHRALSAFGDDVRVALRDLPENQRMVFLLKVEQGLRYDEIASVLKCPVGTAKSRFHHAVRKLREALRDWEEPADSHWRTINGM